MLSLPRALEAPSPTTALALALLLLLAHQALTWTLYLLRARTFARFASTHACLPPPSVPGVPFAGLRHKWTRLRSSDVFDEYMRAVFDARGPTHSIADAVTGRVRTVYTIEPANIKAMLLTRFGEYTRPRTMPNAIGPVMGPGVFTANGHAWAVSRGLVKAQFASHRVRNVAQLAPHVENVYEALGPVDDDGWTQEQDILLVLNRFTLDTATEFLFGTSAGAHAEAMRARDRAPARGLWAAYREILDDFATAFDTALDYVSLRLKLGRWWFLADGVRFRLACWKVRTYAEDYIRRAKRHAEVAARTGEKTEDDGKYGLISNLAHDYPDRVALRDQVMQLLVAGRDTTAATLTWSLVLLESHPECFARLREAVLQVFGTEAEPKAPVTFANLRACTYLQWFIFEVVRLYPTGPLNARRATCNTVLPVGGGPDGQSPVAVQAGTTVAFNVYLLHRRPEFWGADARAFRPERWANRKVGWEYIPFHGGPQTCLGQQHALTEMAYVLTRLLQRFDGMESSTRATNFENSIRTILIPKHRVNMRFRAA